MSQLNSELIRSIPALIRRTEQPHFHAVGSAVQSSIASGVHTKLDFDTKVLDSHNWYDTDNQRYKPLMSGRYFFYSRAYAWPLTDRTYCYIMFYKNGVRARDAFYWMSKVSGGTDEITPFIHTAFVMNGTTDYVEAWVVHNDGTNCSFYHAPSYAEWSFFGGYRFSGS